MIDKKLKSSLAGLTNVSFDGASWEQAVLPVRYGGIGLRRTEDVALPSYVASLHRSQRNICALLPPSCSDSVMQERVKVTEDWQSKAGDRSAPDGEAKNHQRAWDSPLAERHRDSLLSQANQFARARMLSAATSESGAWLRAIPSATIGTLLDSETLRISIALRVGAAVCSPHRCRCGSLADGLGYHSLTCRFSAGRHPRHTALNDVLRRALLSASIPAVLEPIGLDRGDGKRPDGMTLYPFSSGMSLVWDATCVSTFADCNIASAAVAAGEAARVAEAKKRFKYADLAQRYRFEPVAFETAGACGPGTRTLIRELGARLTAASGEKRETEWLWQRLSIAVMRGNATSVLLTSGLLSHEAKTTTNTLTRTGKEACHKSQQGSSRVLRQPPIPLSSPAVGVFQHPPPSPRGANVSLEACDGVDHPASRTSAEPPASTVSVQPPASTVSVQPPASTASVQPAASTASVKPPPGVNSEPVSLSRCPVTLLPEDSPASSNAASSTRRSRLESSCETTGIGSTGGGQSPVRPLGLTGLKNTGNTCFMNSVLQCLSSTLALHDYVLSEKYLTDGNAPTSDRKGALIKAFGTLMCDMWRRSDEPDRVLSTAPVKSEIQRFAPYFMGNQQQDAQEFLRYLLEGLHEDVNRVTSRPKPITTGIEDSLSASQKSIDV